MRSVGIGDLAVSYQGSLQNARLKAELAQLSEELASGRRSDLKSGTGNELSKYAGIHNAITSLNAYAFSAQDAALLAETTQYSFGYVRDLTIDFAPSVLAFGTNGTEPALTTIVQDGRRKFDTVISAFNTSVADRALFSGASVDRVPLANSDTMLADLTLAIAAETTAAGVEAQVVAWFDTVGGGFETVGYLGASSDLAPLALGRDESATLDIRADDQAIRDVLKGYAMLSLASEGALSGDLDEQAALVAIAGQQLFNANDQLGELQANLGVTEEQIEVARARNTAETSALELAEAQIVEADPYRVATELQAAETRLETLFAVTARLSRLSLVNYL